MILQPGHLVHVRSRRWIVEEVHPPPEPRQKRDSAIVRLSCMEDDAQGEQLEVLWDLEVDARPLGEATWDTVVERGFDVPRLFSAYLHTLKWNCVTATRPNLFQAPYRAGIEVKAYQLEPLRRALQMPRVNLFIADDVGLGKTIEAGLILRELLMRQKVRRVVVVAPPSVVRQWRDEMEQRFGLTFQVYDKEYVDTKKRERGLQVNPWTTHSRFILSQALLRDEAYAADLRDWLGEFSARSMLILDEAHNAAPASGGRYAIDSKMTRVVRDLAPRFEHRLFLSATPHNGHSNSFAALLEILDPNRFCRGVPVHPNQLGPVLVRRLKRDIREIEPGDFPERQVLAVRLTDVPDDAPEIQLSRLLQQYRRLREHRLATVTKKQKAAAMLVVTSLQKRLLSSTEAFARTLKVHRKAVDQAVAEAGPDEPAPTDDRRQLALGLLRDGVGSDDDRAELDEDAVEAEADAQMARASTVGAAPPERMRPELDLLDEMSAIAERARAGSDAKLDWLLDWIRDNQCPDLGTEDAAWTDRRLLIFTEYAATKTWLQRRLSAAVGAGARDRIKVFHGGMGEKAREEVKTSFNRHPAEDPLRILIATDAAREGVNLQNHCADLIHFDVPWNPSRMEQRNGRIDRKLQRAPLVRCYYFVIPKRAEDRVLEVLVSKTDTIRKELGALSPVVDARLAALLDEGIREESTSQLSLLIGTIEDQGKGDDAQQVIDEELESTRKRHEDLTRELGRLRVMLEESREWIGLDDRHFRDALSASLEILGADELQPVDANEVAHDASTARWEIPRLHERVGADPSWADTLDFLRRPRKKGEKEAEWRRDAPLRPVVFKDPGVISDEVVHLHLEHRVVQRLLSRFLAQGFQKDAVRRACVVQTDDPQPRVVVLARLSLYGTGASRLHDELVAVAADWAPPDERRGTLRPMLERDKKDVLQLLEEALASERLRGAPQALHGKFAAAAPSDVDDLLPALRDRAEMLDRAARRDLQARGERESAEMKRLLEAQRERIERHRRKTEDDRQQQLDLATAERRQLEADKRHWEARLKTLQEEIEQEPERVRRSYEVVARRIEPAGLIYLWPVSG